MCIFSLTLLPLLFTTSFSHNLKDLLIGEWDVFQDSNLDQTLYTIEFHPSDYGPVAPSTLNCTLWKDEHVDYNSPNSFPSQTNIPLIASIKLNFTSDFSGYIQNVILNPFKKELKWESDSDFHIDFDCHSNFKQKVQFEFKDYKFEIDLSDLPNREIINAEVVLNNEISKFTIRPTIKFENSKTVHKPPVKKQIPKEFGFDDDFFEEEEAKQINSPFMKVFSDLFDEIHINEIINNKYLLITTLLIMVMIYMVAKLILHLICPQKSHKSHKKGNKKEGLKHKKKKDKKAENKINENQENKINENQENKINENQENKTNENQDKEEENANDTKEKNE